MIIEELLYNFKDCANSTLNQNFKKIYIYIYHCVNQLRLAFSHAKMDVSWFLWKKLKIFERNLIGKIKQKLNFFIPCQSTPQYLSSDTSTNLVAIDLNSSKWTSDLLYLEQPGEYDFHGRNK